jgi:hypothetical protein
MMKGITKSTFSPEYGMSCTHESSVVTFRIGYPVKDSQGNAIDQPEGIQLEVQAPGATDFAVAGQCIWPQDTVTWTMGPDGMYIFRARAFFFAVKGPGTCHGGNPRFGPPSANIGVQVKNARPGAAPAPVEICNPCPAPVSTAAAPSLSCASIG